MPNLHWRAASTRRGGAVTLPSLDIALSVRNQPVVSKPGYLTPVTEETFGTKRTRITGDPGTNILDAQSNILGVWGTIDRHGYMTYSPVNYDETLIQIETNTGGTGNLIFLDGNTYVPKYVRSPSGLRESRWERTNPSSMLITDSSVRLRRWNPITDSFTTLRDFSATYSSIQIGAGEGYTDYAGDLVPLYATTGNVDGSGGQWGLVYKISTDTVVFAVDIKTTLSKTLKDARIDVSAYGNYVYLYFGETATSAGTISSPKVWRVS